MESFEQEDRFKKGVSDELVSRKAFSIEPSKPLDIIANASFETLLLKRIP